MSSTMPKGGFVFPYGISLSRDGKVSVFPAAEVLFPTADGEQAAFLLLIDSGATVSALPKFDAEILGIKAEGGVPTMVAGIGGTAIQGWRHELSAILGEEEYKIPLIFLDSQEAPRVLGREGVFERFTIVLEEDKQRSAFVDIRSKESQVIGNVVEQMTQGREGNQ